MFIKLILSSVICFSSVAIAAEITVYRWVDENNVVHFSQNQPKHDQYTEFSIANRDKQTLAPETSELEETELTPEKVIASESLQNNKCEEAKKNVETLTAFEKIQYVDKNGITKVLTALEKGQQLEINKKQMEVYCSSNN